MNTQLAFEELEPFPSPLELELPLPDLSRFFEEIDPIVDSKFLDLLQPSISFDPVGTHMFLEPSCFGLGAEDDSAFFSPCSSASSSDSIESTPMPATTRAEAKTHQAKIFSAEWSPNSIEKQKENEAARARPPARFCHGCWRAESATLRLTVCGNYLTKAGKECRKVECERCRGSPNAGVTLGVKHQCAHCSGKCGPKAQCAVYKKTNQKRKIINQKRKKLKSLRK